jgi:exodeoxyribonuclease-5
MWTAKLMQALQANLEEAVRRGLFTRGSEKNPHLLWRYDGVALRCCIKAYHGRRGHSVVSSDAPILEHLRAGDWGRLQALASGNAGRERPLGHNQHGTLRRLPAPAGAEPRARRAGAVKVADLSSDQKLVFDDVLAWLARPKEQVLTLGGYAGTGKSTLIGLLAQHVGTGQRIGFCAFTGKAASVLRGKLRAAGVPLGPGTGGDGHACGTIHSLIYEAIVDEATGAIREWRRREHLDCQLLVVDEASMVTDEMLADLASYGVPILAVGDHGQLPPVGSRGSLMQHPVLRLEQIHRQARDNPIIELSARIRAGEDPTALTFADPRVRVIRRDAGTAVLAEWLPEPAAAADTIVLCRFNATRVALNEAVRRELGFAPALLCPGDRVVCLRNERFGGVLVANGMRGVVHTVDVAAADPRVPASIHFADEGFALDAQVSRHQFAQERTFAEFTEVPFEAHGWREVGMLFDYGYALTVHKAQGSQFRRAIVFRERGGGGETERRWLYTAVTRASEELVLVGE